MGTLASKDTRRISFDNTFALSPPIAIQKSIEEDHDNIHFHELSTEPDSELFFQEIIKPTESQEEVGIDYWSQRIESLKKEHQIINKIIQTEYDKTTDSTNNTFQQPLVTHERKQKVKPCFDWRVKIVKCYEDNPHQPLACSAAVQAFSKCVASCRIEE